MNKIKSHFYSLSFTKGYINIYNSYEIPLLTNLFCSVLTSNSLITSKGITANLKVYSSIDEFNGNCKTAEETFDFTEFIIVRKTVLPELKNRILFSVSIKAKIDITIKNISVIEMADGQLNLKDIDDCRIFTAPQYKLQCIVRNGFDGFTTDKLMGEPELYDQNSLYKQLVYKDNKSPICYRKDMGDRPGWGQGCYEGFIYNTKDKIIFVFGFVTYKKHLCRIDLSVFHRAFGHFRLYNPIENYYLKAGNTVNSEIAYFSYSDVDPFAARDDYATIAQKYNNCIKFINPMSGWCTWHKKMQNMDEKHLLEELYFIESHQDIFSPDEGCFEYIQIDYCWQKYCGRIDIDETKFPNGLRVISDKIHNMGYKAGIWISPTMIDISKDDHDFNYDLLIKDKCGKPKIYTENWFGKHNTTYGLDITNPKAVEFAIKQIETIIIDWDFDMIKMDFLEGAMVKWGENPEDTVYYNKTTSSVEHLRNFLIAIVEFTDKISQKLGKSIFLSPCGSPLYHLAGIFPLNYIAEDAGYEALDQTMGSAAFALTWATRFNINNRIFTSNLESVLLDEPRSENEAKCLLTCAAMSGGVVFLGDLPHITPLVRLKWFSKILPLYKKQSKPIDYFESQIPELYVIKMHPGSEEEHIVTSIINWTSKTKEYNIPISKLGIDKKTMYHVFSFWDTRYICITDNNINIKLNSVDCCILSIRKASDHPQIVGTDIHVLQGFYELSHIQYNNEILSFLLKFLRKDKHSVYIYIPSNFKITEITSDNPCYTFEYKKENILCITVEYCGFKTVNLRVIFKKEMG